MLDNVLVVPYTILRVNKHKITKGGIHMAKTKNLDDAKKISAIFKEISEESKMMALVYLSALRDKEMADSGRQLQHTG